MKRFCTNCQKEYEFDPVAVAGKEPLICPGCGMEVNKNSRLPGKSGNFQTEEKIGKIYYGFLRMAYLFYMILAVIGITGYLIHVDILLYVTTAVSLVVFLLQLITGTLTFPYGLILLPAGGVAGLFLLHGIPGICVGIQVVFLIRHLYREVIFRIIGWFISLGNK